MGERTNALNPLDKAQDELDKVLIKDMKTGKITRIKLPVRDVLRIVRDLKAEVTLYRQFHSRGRVASLNTLRKVRDAYDKDLLKGVIAAAGSLELVRGSFSSNPCSSRSNALDDARSALDDTYRLAYGKQWEWDLRHLHEIGNSEENALEILQKYDELAEAMQVAQTTRPNVLGLEIYITLHYQAVFTIKFHSDAPFRYIDTAARMYARGLLESERRRQPLEAHGLTRIGIDMMRYEIWKGPEHTKAYFKSLERYKLSKTEVQRRFAEIDEIDDDFYDELAGAIYNNG